LATTFPNRLCRRLGAYEVIGPSEAPLSEEGCLGGGGRDHRDSSNWHAVSREVLHALGPGGIVVNISRGSITDEAAMIALLKSGSVRSRRCDR
jgi:lactate dehydrogenase-like 2-hydroxyacid dehydrogenase